MAQRIKGQDCVIQVIRGGTVETSIADIRNFELTTKFTKLEEQYLGEASKRYDDIFDGMDFKFDAHLESAAVIQFLETLRNRAIGQTRATNVIINIQVSLAFANGVRPRIVLQDCFFENLPLEFGSRSEYGQLTLSGSCSNFERILP